MRIIVLLATVGLATSASAAEFNAFAAAPEALVAPDPEPDIIFELGGGVSLQPAYEGASRYTYGLSPIIGIERFNIPGIFEFGGDDDQTGLSFGPAFDIVGGRNVVDNPELVGLNEAGTTYALGAGVAYGFELTEELDAEIYGELLYGFGGSNGLLGKVGATLTAELTPELEVIGGVSAEIVSDSYMDAYFGVTAAESARTGGLYSAYDPAAGLKSVNLDLSARYEFMPDTFFNAGATYTQYVGSAASSPIVQRGSASNFTVEVGISRRFGMSF